MLIKIELQGLGFKYSNSSVKPSVPLKLDKIMLKYVS